MNTAGDRKKMTNYVCLHIGKTGGNFLFRHFSGLPPTQRGRIITKGHQLTLRMVLDNYPHRQILFAIRDPIDMFVSAFNSRLRKGRPATFHEWTDGEKRIFERFSTPNAAAEALCSNVKELRDLAERSFIDIEHIRRCLSHYLGGITLINAARHKIGFIFSTVELETDLHRFAEMSGLSLDFNLKLDAVRRHATPTGYCQTLSSQARQNLRGKLQREYIIYEFCKEIRENILRDIGG